MLLRTILIFLFVGIPLLSFSQGDGDSLVATTYYYEGGQKSSEGFLRNGKPDAYWKSYYRNGKLKAEGDRKDYKLNGPWIFYNREGLKTAEINYQAGQKEGPRKAYEEGVLSKVDYFKEDVQIGITEYFYPNGSLKKEVPFENGKESGQGFEYDLDDARVITLLQFKNSSLIRKQNVNRYDSQKQKQGLWMVFHKNKKIRIEGPYLNDLRNGYWKYYTSEGDLIRVEKWVNGELQEGATEVAKVDIKREIYPETGTLKFKGALQNGQATGVHREYDKEGNVVASTIYDQGIKLFEGIVDGEGRKQGPWKHFYRSGELKASGSYKDDLKVGAWRYFFRDSTVEQRGSYANGKANGLWEWFFEDGSTLREEEYAFGLEDGASIEYNDTGAVVAQGEFVDGFKEGKWEYTINDHQEVGSYFEGLRNGLWQHYYLSNNQLRFEGNFENGQENGAHIEYYDNGQVKRRGEFQAGIKQGIWEFFESNGERTVTIEYVDGEETKYNGEKIDYGRRYRKALEAEKAREALSDSDEE